MISLKSLDWRSFLARPVLSASAPPLSCAHQPILITGAGGSIGSALALRLAQSAAASLVLLEASESNLYQLQRACVEQVERGPAAPAAFILGDAGDRATLADTFAAHRPRLVFHAAAHKHVPLLEQQPFAAIANNIFATQTLAAVAADYGVRIVLLSTDKAVSPASLMGASKRVAEQIVLAGGGTVLRLGNVLASSGSVTEVFAQQIVRGGPLTVTDPTARRYFLTIDEAVNLLFRAAAHPNASTLLAPVLPAAHSIADLAAFMARTLAPGRNIPIQFTSLRPGDKLAEQLWEDSDVVAPSGSTNLLAIQSAAPNPVAFQKSLAALRTAAQERDLPSALAALRALVPNFDPSPAVLALAQKPGTRAFV